jgi:hypothetical protein
MPLLRSLLVFPLPKALSVPVEKDAPGCLAAATLSSVVPSLAGQTGWMIARSCTAAFETLCSARLATDYLEYGVSIALFIKESSMQRLELPQLGKRADESLSETNSQTLAPFGTGTAPYSTVWSWLEQLNRQPVPHRACVRE